MAQNKSMYAQVTNFLAGVLRGRRPNAKASAAQTSGNASFGGHGCLILSEMRTSSSMYDGFMRIQRA